MATIHLICGSTGAGKTAYAVALARRARAVRFCIDEWMFKLFAADRPEPHPLAWSLERTARCEAQMWVIADQIIAREVDVVFDVGLSRRDHRDQFRARAMQTRGAPKLHYLDVDVATRRARVLRRNESRTGIHDYPVTEAMFDIMETWFETPTDDELYGGMIVCDG